MSKALGGLLLVRQGCDQFVRFLLDAFGQTLRQTFVTVVRAYVILIFLVSLTNEVKLFNGVNSLYFKNILKVY